MLNRKKAAPPGARPGRFWLLLALGSGALCAGYAALVLGTASWAEARALDGLYALDDNWHIRAFSPAGWQRAQRLLAGLAAGLGAAWLALGPATGPGRHELRATLAQGQRLVGREWGQWGRLSRARRWVFGAQLGALTAVRLYLGLTTPWNDDAASYGFFVRHGLLAVSAYYPIPNNHLLSNTIAWVFYQLQPGFWWTMRLPVLLISTLATLGLYMAMRRRLGYWPALLAAGASSWVALGLYQAAAGRAYWLTIGLTVGLFCALLALLRPGPGARRLAWVSLVATGVLGLYAVPTFAYALGSALTWLAGQALWQRRWALLARAVAAGALIGGGAVLLYVPALFVSGPQVLLANPFVQPLAAADFWRQLPAHAWITEGFLLGQRGLGAAGTLLVLGLFGYLLWRWRAGRLAPGLARQVREVGLPALWFVGWPYALLLGQRVLPPERTWLYKAWFGYLLVALVLAGWRWHRPARRWLVGLAAAVFVLYQVTAQLRDNRQARRRLAPDGDMAAWLARHPQARPVLVPDDGIWNWQTLQAHVNDPRQPWAVDRVALPGVRYGYVLTRAGAPAPAGTGSLVFAVGTLRLARYNAPPVAGPPTARKHY
ncbi:hypothetical protein QMK33_11745 [Hymenobacter sp. H14-R3]|uniref:hypothetical protein n=1 Tax=Hymenobacter sp. H14-R3 TaxID=3046308 RepID=UPI0024BA7257|nr:hypothetical protein [Hymenobacter sp. H14-R3]MDJ0365826.1 hypothetical protein [Hymenobacter sp. H14-R3]